MPEALQIQDTSYAGTAEMSTMLTLAVIEADTVDKGCVYVQDGIKKQKTMPRIDVTNIIQRRAATPTSQGQVTVTGKVLAPLDYMLYYEFNPRDYEQHWYAEQLSPTLITRQLPQTAEAFMVMQTLKRVIEFNENAMWRSRLIFDPTNPSYAAPSSKGQTGDDAYYYWDGLITKLLNDSTTIKVSGVTYTSSNIIAQFYACLQAVPKPLLYKYGKMGLKFHISYLTQQLYEEALTNTTYKNNDTTEKGINRYKGYEVVPLAGIPDNTIVLTITKPDLDSRLWIGINSEADDNELQLMKLQNNSELYFVKALMKMDTQSSWGQEIVIQTTITA